MDMRDIKEFMLDTGKYIVFIIIILTVLIYIFSFQLVIGDSMRPTLNDREVLFLSRSHYKFFDIKRYDIVSLQQNSQYLVKRVIGLPNEELEIIEGVVYINGVALKEDYLKLKGPNYAEINNDKINIPENYYFVLGDNRLNSLDSRQFGLVNENEIMGKNIFRLWPINRFKIF